VVGLADVPEFPRRRRRARRSPRTHWPRRATRPPPPGCRRGRRLRARRRRAERHAGRAVGALERPPRRRPRQPELLLAQVGDVPDERRGAAFVCAAALVVPGGPETVVHGRGPGVSRGPRGAPTASATTRSSCRRGRRARPPSCRPPRRTQRPTGPRAAGASCPTCARWREALRVRVPARVKRGSCSITRSGPVALVDVRWGRLVAALVAVLVAAVVAVCALRWGGVAGVRAEVAAAGAWAPLLFVAAAGAGHDHPAAPHDVHRGRGRALRRGLGPGVDDHRHGARRAGRVRAGAVGRRPAGRPPRAPAGVRVGAGAAGPQRAAGDGLAAPAPHGAVLGAELRRGRGQGAAGALILLGTVLGVLPARSRSWCSATPSRAASSTPRSSRCRSPERRWAWRGATIAARRVGPAPDPD
jgi:hypothetical protein